MDAANPFAQTPTTPEPIIAQVRRQLLEEAGDDVLVQNSGVDGMVDRVVRELWGGRVKTFVPVLALRETRELLRQHGIAAPVPGPESPQAFAGVSLAKHQAGRSVHDVMAIEGDVVALDRGDVLPIDERDVLPL